MLKKTVQDLIERLDPNQYIAVGSSAATRKKGTPTGSSFYFIGRASQYKKDIYGINLFFAKSMDFIPLESRIIIDVWNRHIPGEPPMLAILAEGAENGKVALLSEYDKTYKMPPTKIKDMNGFHTLRMAITQNAVNDYINAVRVGGKTSMLDNFFESEWGELITGSNGRKVEEVCTLRGHYAAWRDGKKCGKCGRLKCIHRNGTHFTTMEKGEISCPKEEEAD